ncbi:MAG: hypothetical protein RIT81_01465 [Deltaproteobacteria bacterium]
MGSDARIQGSRPIVALRNEAEDEVPAAPPVLPDAPVNVPKPPPAARTPGAGWQLLRGLKTMAVVGAVAALSLGMTNGAALADSCDVPAAEAQTMEREEVVLRESLCRYVQSDFAGDWDAAWRHHAGADDRVDRGELRQLLKDADVGGGFTRGFWVNGVLDKFDGVGGPQNGAIDRSELDAALD